MKIDKIVVFFIIIVVVLIGGIWWLWPKNIKKVTKPVVVDSSLIKQEFEAVKDNGVKVKSRNMVGIIKKWDSVANILTIEDKNNLAEFEINPDITKVYLTLSLGRNEENKMTLINKGDNPTEWKNAFCVGDGVSFVVETDTEIVDTVFGTGYRDCLIRGDMK